jgi:hypothetical protein
VWSDDEFFGVGDLWMDAYRERKISIAMGVYLKNKKKFQLDYSRNFLFLFD